MHLHHAHLGKRLNNEWRHNTTDRRRSETKHTGSWNWNHSWIDGRSLHLLLTVITCLYQQPVNFEVRTHLESSALPPYVQPRSYKSDTNIPKQRSLGNSATSSMQTTRGDPQSRPDEKSSVMTASVSTSARGADGKRRREDSRKSWKRFCVQVHTRRCRAIVTR